MKASRIVSLFLVLVMLAALVLTSCQKVSKSDVEKDPAGENIDAAEKTFDGLKDSFSPVAESSDALKKAGLIEINWKNDDIGVDLSGKVAYEKESLKSYGELGLKYGDSSVALKLYGDKDNFAIESPELFKGAYGVDLTTVVEDIKKSDLFEDSGVDVDEVAAGVKKALDAREKLASDEDTEVKKEFDKLKDKFIEQLNKTKHVVEKKDISSAGRNVTAIVTTFELDTDAICDLLEVIADNSEDLFDEFSGVIEDLPVDDLPKSLRGIDDLDYDDFVNGIDDLIDEIEDEDIEGKITVSLDPKTAELLKFEFSVETDEGTLEGEIDVGQQVEDFSKITGSITSSTKEDKFKSETSLEFTFTRRDDADKFLEEIELGYSSSNVSDYSTAERSMKYENKEGVELSVTFDHNKKDKSYELTAEFSSKSSGGSTINGNKQIDTDESSGGITISGAFEYDSKGLTFGVDEISVESDGKSVFELEDFGLTVKITTDPGIEKVPEFKSLFAMDEDDFEDLGEEIGDNARDLAEDFRDLVSAFSKFAGGLGGAKAEKAAEPADTDEP